MDKSDVNLVQDVKIAQALMKPFLEKVGDQDKLTQINIIVQANKIDQVQETPKSSQNFVLPDVKELSEIEYASWMRDSLFNILEALPQPRYRHIIKLMIEVAQSKFRKKSEAARWLGMGRQAFYQWINRFNLRGSYVENAVEKLENRIRKVNL